MPRACSICTHPRRAKIDRDLAAGIPFAELVERYSTSLGTLHRHKSGRHTEKEALELVADAVVAEQAIPIPPLALKPPADDLAGQIRHLQTEALYFLDLAKQRDDVRGAAAIIGQARSNIEMLAELAGELERRGTVHVTNQIAIVQSPDWARIRTKLLDALEAFPEAREAAARALLEVGGG